MRTPSTPSMVNDWGELLTESDKVRASVHVHCCSGDIAIALRRQIGGDRSDLLGKSGPAEIAGLVKVVVDPRHDVIRVGGVEAVGGQNIAELFGEAGGHDG